MEKAVRSAIVACSLGLPDGGPIDAKPTGGMWFRLGLRADAHGRGAMRDQLCDNGGDPGKTVADLDGWLLSVKEQILAGLPDLIRQRSVVQVHLGRPKCF
jgi:hypothetical protein